MLRFCGYSFFAPLREIRPSAVLILYICSLPRLLRLCVRTAVSSWFPGFLINSHSVAPCLPGSVVNFVPDSKPTFRPTFPDYFPHLSDCERTSKTANSNNSVRASMKPARDFPATAPTQPGQNEPNFAAPIGTPAITPKFNARPLHSPRLPSLRQHILSADPAPAARSPAPLLKSPNDRSRP